jgi:hypothetical protein
MAEHLHSRVRSDDPVPYCGLEDRIWASWNTTFMANLQLRVIRDFLFCTGYNTR